MSASVCVGFCVQEMESVAHGVRLQVKGSYVLGAIDWCECGCVNEFMTVSEYHARLASEEGS